MDRLFHVRQELDREIDEFSRQQEYYHRAQRLVQLLEQREQFPEDTIPYRSYIAATGQVATSNTAPSSASSPATLAPCSTINQVFKQEDTISVHDHSGMQMGHESLFGSHKQNRSNETKSSSDSSLAYVSTDSSTAGAAAIAGTVTVPPGQSNATSVPTFSHPFGICFDFKNNHTIVSEESGHSFQIIRNHSTLVRRVGGYGTGKGQFMCCGHVTMQPDTNYIVVTDGNNHRVQLLMLQLQLLMLMVLSFNLL